MHRNGGSLPFTTLTLAYMALLCILSLVPVAESAGHPWYDLRALPPNIQNLCHLPAYGLLALIWIVTFRSYGSARLQTVMCGALIAALYGVLLELAQAIVPGRYPSISDCVLNVSGILIFTVCYLIVTSRGFGTWLELGSTATKLWGEGSKRS